jgi:hypothetical protein
MGASFFVIAYIKISFKFKLSLDLFTCLNLTDNQIYKIFWGIVMVHARFFQAYPANPPQVEPLPAADDKYYNDQRTNLRNKLSEIYLFAFTHQANIPAPDREILLTVVKNGFDMLDAIHRLLAINIELNSYPFPRKFNYALRDQESPLREYGIFYHEALSVLESLTNPHDGYPNLVENMQVFTITANDILRRLTNPDFIRITADILCALTFIALGIFLQFFIMPSIALTGFGILAAMFWVTLGIIVEIGGMMITWENLGYVRGNHAKKVSAFKESIEKVTEPAPAPFHI